MKLKKVFALCLFLATTQLFASTLVKNVDQCILTIQFTPQETLTLQKLNTLNIKNKKVVLTKLNSLYNKELEKVFISENKEDSED